MAGNIFAYAGILLGILIGIISFTLVSYEDQDFEIMKNMDIYYTMFRELNLFYVDETDPGELIKTSIDKMLKSLDPYTVYIPESKIEDYRFMTTGQYGGIGALIRKSFLSHYIVLLSFLLTTNFQKLQNHRSNSIFDVLPTNSFPLLIIC